MKTLCINRVILESDAQQIISALNSIMKNFFYFDLIINDYKIFVKDLIECFFVFTNRLTNKYYIHLLGLLIICLDD